jgi:hypothetical protein
MIDLRSEGHLYSSSNAFATACSSVVSLPSAQAVWKAKERRSTFHKSFSQDDTHEHRGVTELSYHTWRAFSILVSILSSGDLHPPIAYA